MAADESVRPLEGQVALVTGASRGIGATTAVLLAQAGAKVAITARTESALARVAAACDEQLGVALPVLCDVAQPEQVERLFREIDDRLGPVELLVNNAAVLHPGPLHEQPAEAWGDMIAVNLAAVVRVTQLALARMRPRGRGVIVNVASVAGIAGVERFPGTSVYAATKAAVIALSETLAVEQAEAGIRVVCVSPGSTKTDMLAQVVSAEEHAAAPHPVTVGRRILELVQGPLEDGATHLVLGQE